MKKQKLKLDEVNNNRILIVDDNPEIHEDYKKVLTSSDTDDRKGLTGGKISYEIDSAYSVEDALSCIKKSLEKGAPYALIFMDVCIPRGINGVEAIRGIWELNPDVEVVICSTYSDNSREEIIKELGSSDHLLFLKKPFNAIELKQMASALVRKWNLHDTLKNVINNLENEVKHRTEELEKANKDLQRANDWKTRFFINLAHDTRTPLTLIQNYLEKYIARTGMDADLRVLKQNIDLLLRNMVNFLDVEKLRRGQIFFNHNQETRISEVLKNKIILFKEIAQKNSIIMTDEVEEGLSIKADPYAVDRIINNIIENSIKYTSRMGAIHVSLLKKGNKINFMVRDNGIGMTGDQLNNIFLPYYQLSHKKRNIQGIGMGLYIVKRIVDALDGEINIESTPRAGTRFEISFPLFIRSGKRRLAKTIPGTDTVINPDIAAALTPPIELVPRELVLREENIADHKNNVLFVDDNIEMLYFIKTFLKEKYNVYVAENVKDAITVLARIPLPDIIISDIMMDNLDGYQFFSYIREHEKHNDIPFIFLTAKSSLKEKLQGLSEGAVDYIYKPFFIEELTAKIESIIENRVKMKKKYRDRVESGIKKVLTHLRGKNNLNETYLVLEALANKYNLSKREQQVVISLLDGYINKEISDRLKISIRTVEFHLSNVYKKLNVKNKIELVNLFK